MRSTYRVKPGDSLSAIAKNVYNDLSLWPQIARANNIRAPYLIQPGQELTIPPKNLKTIAVAVDGWPGDHGTVGNKFQICRDTVAKEGEPKQWKLYSAHTIKDFFELFDELHKSVDAVEEFHFFSHFYGNEGPQFLDGKHFVAIDDLEKTLARALWASSAAVCFHGCNSGASSWTQKFADTQHVTVKGCAGFAVFSKKSNYWEMPSDSMTEKTPLYLDSFQGATFIVEQWARKGALPAWLSQCLARGNGFCWNIAKAGAISRRDTCLREHCPPAGMIEVTPLKPK